MRESRENMTPPAMSRLMIVVFMLPLIVGMLRMIVNEGCKCKNITRVRNCPDITIWTSLSFSLLSSSSLSFSSLSFSSLLLSLFWLSSFLLSSLSWSSFALSSLLWSLLSWSSLSWSSSVTNSSDGLIFVKRRAKDGRFFSKNTGVRRAKFKLCIKKCE